MSAPSPSPARALELDGAETVVERSVQSYGAGVAIIPLILVLVMALSTRMVEFSLFTCVFVGSCIVEGEVNSGFKRTLDKYILVRADRSVDWSIGILYLLTLCLDCLARVPWQMRIMYLSYYLLFSCRGWLASWYECEGPSCDANSVGLC
jgi:hypothetical protein